MSKLTKNLKVSRHSGMSDSTMISTLKKRQSEYFKKKVIDENIDVLELLPCSFAAVEEVGEMMVQGSSKLNLEHRYAASIPNRKVISKHLLESEQWEKYGGGPTNKNTEEIVLAEHYDGKKTYFI